MQIYIVEREEGRRRDSIKFFISPPAPVLVSRQCQIVCLPPQTSVYKIPKIPSFFILTLFEIYSSVYIVTPSLPPLCCTTSDKANSGVMEELWRLNINQWLLAGRQLRGENRKKRPGKFVLD